MSICSKLSEIRNVHEFLIWLAPEHHSWYRRIVIIFISDLVFGARSSPLRKRLFFRPLLKTHMIVRISSGILPLVAKIFSSRHFRRLLVFSGPFPLGYDVLLCFWCLVWSCAPLFSARCLLGTVRTNCSTFFMSWNLFLDIGRPAGLFLFFADPQGHIFVPAGATRPPTRRQNSY